MALKLMYITNNPDVALIAEKYGVDRIWIDLETLGKEERQSGMNTVKSNHKIDDIKQIAPLLTKAEMLVRINPWNKNSCDEVDAVIDAGAEVVMLPMWRNVQEVESFVQAVNSRVTTVLLLETKEAEECLDDVLKVEGIDEIHIGLNDLHLSYGMTFMFELLSNGTVEKICNKIKAKGIPYGFGGIAKLGTGDLPAERIVLEHYRLGSTRAILSRGFCNTDIVTDLSEIDEIFEKNILELRKYETTVAQNADKELFEKNKIEVTQGVHAIVEKRKKKMRSTMLYEAFYRNTSGIIK